MISKRDLLLTLSVLCSVGISSVVLADDPPVIASSLCLDDHQEEAEERTKTLRRLFRKIQPGLEWRFSMGNSYDSNALFLGKSMRTPNGLSGKGDYRFGLEADANFSHVIPLDRKYRLGRTLTLGVGGTASQNWHANISEFDRGRYMGRAFANFETEIDVPYFPGYDRGGVFLGVQYEHETSTLNRDTFFFSNRITPALTVLWRRDPDNIRWKNEMDRTTVYYSFDQRNYRDEISDPRLDRDGTYQAIGFQHSIYIIKAQHLWPAYYEGLIPTTEDEEKIRKGIEDQDYYYSHQWLRFNLGYEYRKHRTDGGEFDLNGNAIMWGVHIPLPYKLTFDVEGEFAWGNFPDSSIFDIRRDSRSDFSHRYNFGLTRAFYYKTSGPELIEMKIRAGTQLTFQDSSVSSRFGTDVFDYDRAVYGIQVELSQVQTRYSRIDIDILVPSRGVTADPEGFLQVDTTTQVTTTLGMSQGNMPIEIMMMPPAGATTLP
ncbi:MAG: hypothetical protein MI923_06290 [Phycisphaerales bacterium]|nr:hypothetical protein [Phycisphaerales bacterium]